MSKGRIFCESAGGLCEAERNKPSAVLSTVSLGNSS